MKTKKPLIITLAAVLVVVLAAIAGIVFLNPFKGTPVPTSKPSAGASEYKNEEAKSKALVDTKQYSEAQQSAYAQFFKNTEGVVAPTTVPLAAWTANQYIQNAFLNPYFVSGYWAAKDNYDSSAIQKYLSPWVSEDLNKEFLKVDQTPGTPEFISYFSNKVYMPDSTLKINPSCFDTWNKEYCFSVAPPPQITDMHFKALTQTSVQVDATVNVAVQYQKPDAPDGNLILQDRDYHVTFVISEKNLPTSKDTKKPIMIIEQVSSTLEIKGNTDYLIGNASE